MTNVAALKQLYAALGGIPSDVAQCLTIPDVISAIAYLKTGKTEVAAMNGSTELWGYTISQLQSDIEVENGEITGSLDFVGTGTLADVWGDGNFIALTFTPNSKTTEVSVAILPTEGAGWQKLDEDLACVFKVTDKETQKIHVKSTDGVNEITQVYGLSGLTVVSK